MNDIPAASASGESTLLKRAIGLTGGIASGKSEVARYLQGLGFVVVDADQMARDVVRIGAPTLAEITAAFGSEYLTTDGALDRAKMRALISRDPEARKRLDAIMHPAIRRATIGQVRGFTWEDHSSDLRRRLWFYEASLLIETGAYRDFSEIWLVKCLPETQLARLVERDAATPTDAAKLIQAQWPAAQKAAYATEIIDTERGLTEVTTQVDELLKQRGFG